MKTIFVLMLALSFNLTFAQTVDEGKVMKLLDRLHTTERMMWNVPREDGRMLRILVAASGAKNILEIGTSNGVSTIWMGLGAAEHNGRITTLEIDHERAEMARENFKKAGMDKMIRLIEGDALQEIPKLSGPFDFVFIDAQKSDYKKYFDLVFPKLARGGIIAAHNTYGMASAVADFLQAVENNPQLVTQTFRASETGMTVSYKKRLDK